MEHSLENRVIGLAGAYQAAALVWRIAWEGRYDRDAFAASLGSLLRIDAPTPEAVFGGLGGLRLGLEMLIEAFTRPAEDRTRETTRYVISLIHLERKLDRAPRNQASIRSGIEETRTLLDRYEPTHVNIVHRLAEIYRTAVSSLGPRILVRGEPSILQDADQAARIRALLLAGLRAVVLWRQANGRRWRLILERRQGLEVARGLLEQARVGDEPGE
jgi:high frequency lysogenization protein